MPHLLVQTHDQPDQTHELSDEATLGRGEDVTVKLLDPKVSRQHCRVCKDVTGWRVEDLGSSNGLKVNGVRRKKHPLKSGDRIEIGRTVVTFRADARKKFATPKRKSARERLADGDQR